MVYDVMISYAKVDKTTADAVCAKLESKGIHCWIAPRDILPGKEWGEAIIDAIFFECSTLAGCIHTSFGRTHR